MNQEEKIAQMTWREILHVVYDVLNYPLFELDGHNISLGKLISGVILLVVGYLISRRGAKEVDRRLLVKLNVDEALRYTFRRLTFYAFMFLTTLVILHLLAVPVTIFTVLGGAFAVGIGFGSQNLINNFISGVLVMVERPIRVGDVIDVDGVSGTVATIGIRSTIVRTGANAEVIIPNTTFIEKNLTNWTMSANVQAGIRLGVAYSTDIEKLRRVCFELVKAMPVILQEPPPDLVFSDFADSVLLFDLRYFVPTSSVPDRGAIASELRYRVHAAFKANGIEMPFPQREVRMLT